MQALIDKIQHLVMYVDDWPRYYCYPLDEGWTFYHWRDGVELHVDANTFAIAAKSHGVRFDLPYSDIPLRPCVVCGPLPVRMPPTEYICLACRKDMQLV